MSQPLLVCIFPHDEGTMRLARYRGKTCINIADMPFASFYGSYTRDIVETFRTRGFEETDPEPGAA